MICARFLPLEANTVLLQLTVVPRFQRGATLLYALNAMSAPLVRIEGLHDAARTYAPTIFQNLLVSFCTARYGEKQQKTLELLIYFMEGFEISSECAC